MFAFECINDGLQSARTASECEKKHGLFRGINECLLKSGAEIDLGSPVVFLFAHKDEMRMIGVERHFTICNFAWIYYLQKDKKKIKKKIYF